MGKRRIQDSPLLPRLVRPQGRRLRPAARIHRLLLDVRCRYRRPADGKLPRRRRHHAHHRCRPDCRPWRRQHGIFHLGRLAEQCSLPLLRETLLSKYAGEEPLVLLRAEFGEFLLRGRKRGHENGGIQQRQRHRVHDAPPLQQRHRLDLPQCASAGLLAPLHERRPRVELHSGAPFRRRDGRPLGCRERPAGELSRACRRSGGEFRHEFH